MGYKKCLILLAVLQVSAQWVKLSSHLIHSFKRAFTDILEKLFHMSYIYYSVIYEKV